MRHAITVKMELSAILRPEIVKKDAAQAIMEPYVIKVKTERVRVKDNNKIKMLSIVLN